LEGKRAARAASSEESLDVEVSRNRTFLLELEVEVGGWEGSWWRRRLDVRPPVLVLGVLSVLGLLVFARAKSSLRVGSLGVDSVVGMDEVLLPWNWRERSLYWVRRLSRDSVSEERVARDSMPSRKDSREREMLESCDGFGSRFSEIARWRSKRESLMWSARRRSWEGLDISSRLREVRMGREVV
jgi:hypothetical protein